MDQPEFMVSDTSADYAAAPDEFALIKKLNVDASLGHGAVISDESEIGRFAFRKDWLFRNGLNHKEIRLIGVKGDSMTPTIDDGDMLLIDTGCSEYQGDGVYVLRVDSELVAKRMQSDLSGGFFIKSDNAAYREIHIDKDSSLQVDVVAKVERVISISEP
ncbi:MAG: helix-turn-helix transcriptional regulator [Immundisolibacteraceae bacterium]|nr:helix-turn-helix transcriptional regulator [Immundisolibacteraceae bacterium]